MSKPTPFTTLAFAAGLACAALLLWIWRASSPPAGPAHSTALATPPLAEKPVASSPLPAAERDGLSAEARAMLTTLVRALAAGGVRDRETVLTFKDDDALRRFLSRAAQSRLSILGQLDALRSVRVRFDSVGALQRELAENAADYSSLGANALFGIPHPPAKQDRAAVDQVPFGNDMLAFLGATGDRSAWGRGITIAILDTGVAADTTFGVGRVQSLDIGRGLTPGHGGDDGHGTAVAALAAGLSPDAGGVAPGANLLSIRVTDASGVSDLFTISQAVVAAVDAGARIINVSLGGYATGPVLDAAIGYATQRGALIVAAAGNDQAAQLSWPAADARVVSVGAIDRAEQQVSFSNSGAQLQLTAPGYGVQTAWLDGQRVIIDGTSASAPLVAGAIAAVLSLNSAFTPRAAADLLARTANDGGAPGADAAFGRGILNLATAMNSGNPAYIDTAVSSHHFDATTNQMQFVVQNRSGRSVTGMTLAVTSGTITTTSSVPSLSAGETYVAKVPVNDTALTTAGQLTFTTQLVNPTGTVDQAPANNRRTSLLTAPKP